MPRFRRDRAATTDPRAVWAACSVLLDYPTPELLASLDHVAALVPDHPQLGPVVEHLRTTPLRELQEEYVQTFDHSRRCTPYLTYFAYGDTRRRGMALLAFKQAYRAAGVVWDDEGGELPDHLSAVLRLGATVDADAARRLLEDHRAGLEMMRLALASWESARDGGTGSPWTGVLAAVCDTLPALRGDEADAVRRLVEQGPPAEEVGLDAYGADLATRTSTGSPVIATTIPVGVPS